MSPVYSYKKWHEEQSKDPEFIEEMEKLEPGYQVARLRIQKGLSQTQLAEIIGTKQPSIARLERGEYKPSLSFLEKIANALGAEIKISFVPREFSHEIREDTISNSYNPEKINHPC